MSAIKQKRSKKEEDLLITSRDRIVESVRAFPEWASNHLTVIDKQTQELVPFILNVFSVWERGLSN